VTISFSRILLHRTGSEQQRSEEAIMSYAVNFTSDNSTVSAHCS